MFTATGVMIYIRGLRTSRGREIHSLNPPQNATCIKIAPQTPYPQHIIRRSQSGLSMQRYRIFPQVGNAGCLVLITWSTDQLNSQWISKVGQYFYPCWPKTCRSKRVSLKNPISCSLINIPTKWLNILPLLLLLFVSSQWLCGIIAGSCW